MGAHAWAQYLQLVSVRLPVYLPPPEPSQLLPHQTLLSHLVHQEQ